MERRSGGGARATRAASANGRLVGPQHHGVALGVEAAAPGPPGQLRVLARGERGPAGAAELGEALDDDRARRHVDAERQRLGGEDHLQAALGEALLDRLAEGRDEARVVGGQPGLETLEPFGVARGRRGRRRRATRRGASAMARMACALGPGGEPEPVAQALADRVVARGAAEDEDDGRAAAPRPRAARPPRSAPGRAHRQAHWGRPPPGPRAGASRVRPARRTAWSIAERLVAGRPVGEQRRPASRSSSARRWTAKWWRSVIGRRRSSTTTRSGRAPSAATRPARWRWTPWPTGRRR